MSRSFNTDPYEIQLYRRAGRKPPPNWRQFFWPYPGNPGKTSTEEFSEWGVGAMRSTSRSALSAGADTTGEATGASGRAWASALASSTAEPVPRSDN
jgi:hypothetical protein